MNDANAAGIFAQSLWAAGHFGVEEGIVKTLKSSDSVNSNQAHVPVSVQLGCERRSGVDFLHMPQCEMLQAATFPRLSIILHVLTRTRSRHASWKLTARPLYSESWTCFLVHILETFFFHSAQSFKHGAYEFAILYHNLMCQGLDHTHWSLY